MRDHFNDIPDGAKYIIDALSFTTLLGTLAKILPHVAASLTIVWTAIRIYETSTFQSWLERRRK